MNAELVTAQAQSLENLGGAKTKLDEEARLLSGLTVTNKEDRKTAVSELKKARGLIKEVATERASVTKPLDEFKKKVMAMEKEAVAEITSETSALDRRIKTFDAEEEAARRRELEKREAELAEKRRAEEEKATQEKRFSDLLYFIKEAVAAKDLAKLKQLVTAKPNDGFYGEKQSEALVLIAKYKPIAERLIGEIEKGIKQTEEETKMNLAKLEQENAKKEAEERKKQEEAEAMRKEEEARLRHQQAERKEKAIASGVQEVVITDIAAIPSHLYQIKFDLNGVKNHLREHGKVEGAIVKTKLGMVI